MLEVPKDIIYNATEITNGNLKQEIKSPKLRLFFLDNLGSCRGYLLKV